MFLLASPDNFCYGHVMFSKSSSNKLLLYRRSIYIRVRPFSPKGNKFVPYTYSEKVKILWFDFKRKKKKIFLHYINKYDMFTDEYYPMKINY